MWFLLNLFGHFWALPVIWQVRNIWKININMIFLIKMRGLPSFYDQRLTRYRFLALLTPFGHIWPCLVIFRHFRSSERYELYETLIGIWCFWSKWAVYQVSKINSSWYINFSPFGSFLATFDPFWPILGNFEHFWLSDRFEFYHH